MPSNIITRLNRIKGQIAGIAKMIEDEKDCEQIIIQFQAVQSALSSAFNEFLKTNLQQCLDKKNNKKNIRRINKILKILLEK